jgi:hypothetical protein
MVCTSRCFSFSSVTLPTPGRRSTGSGNRNESISSGCMTKSPSGFFPSPKQSSRGIWSAPLLPMRSSSVLSESVRGSRVPLVLRWQASRLCPNAVFLPPDFPRYRAVSSQVREIFKRHTDLIEPLSLDEAYLDVSENRFWAAQKIRELPACRQQGPWAGQGFWASYKRRAGLCPCSALARHRPRASIAPVRGLRRKPRSLANGSLHLGNLCVGDFGATM